MTKQRCGSCHTPTDYDDLTRAQDVEERMFMCGWCQGAGEHTDSGSLVQCKECNGPGQTDTNAALRDYVQDREPMCPTCYSGAVQELGGKEDSDE